MNENNENQVQNFEEAQNATEKMFEEQPSEEVQSVENMLADRLEQQQEEQAAEREAQNEQTNEVLNNAEAAANAVQEQNIQNSQLSAENQQLRETVQAMQQQMASMNEQMQSMQEQARQQSELQKNAILENSVDMPRLDVSELAFADEDTARQIQEDYAKSMSEYIRSQTLNELSPYIREAEIARAEKERASAIEALSQDEAFADIRELEPQIKSLMGENGIKFASDMSPEEQTAMAYIVARGVNAMNAPKPKEPSAPTLDELMRFYGENPEFQAAVEEKRINDLKTSQQVPPMSASQGAANAALYIKEKPKDFDEAGQAASELFSKLLGKN